MNVKEVLAAFSDPSENEEEVKTLWMMVIDQNNRIGYMSVDTDINSSFSEILFSSSPFATEQTLKRAAELLRADNTIDLDFSKRPRIEDVSPAMRNLFDNMESCDAITYFDEIDNAEWENLGLSKEEYEQQIDSDIEKFGLSDIVCKGEDDEALYTCYGDFLCAFSKPGGKELENSGHIDGETSEISSLIPEDGTPLASISFVPIEFQKDKEAPFKICEIIDRRDQTITYVVVRNGKDEAIFTACGSKGQQRDHAFFSALNFIAESYHDTLELVLDNFDGPAYAKKYYEVALYSNPATRFQYSPMALDAHWKNMMPEIYSSEKVFGDTLINGELSPHICAELEMVFNSSLEIPNFHFDDVLLSQLESQPPITEVRVLDNNTDIAYTPLFAAAQYEWEHDRTAKIFDMSGKELLSCLNALDSAIEKYGPTRASLDCFSDLLNDLCYSRNNNLIDLNVPLVSNLGSSNSMESVYINCRKVLKEVELAMKQDKNSVLSV